MMTKQPKALINFSKKADPSMETKSQEILQSMTGNANFPSPIPALEVVQDAQADYSTALINAASRDKTKVALKNQARLELEKLLKQLGNYVNTVSMGDVAMLTSSGYDISKMPEPRHITTPENVKLVPGMNDGSLISQADAVKGASSYIHQIAPDPLTADTKWTSISTSRRKYEFTSLEQGKKYWVRIAAVGSNEQVAYSTEVSQYVM